jgi:hypothetical protein
MTSASFELDAEFESLELKPPRVLLILTEDFSVSSTGTVVLDASGESFVVSTADAVVETADGEELNKRVCVRLQAGVFARVFCRVHDRRDWRRGRTWRL